MAIPQVSMQSTKGQISISTTPPVQEIQQRPADLSIQQPKADLRIETTPGKLTIDQSQAWADMDLKPISKRIEEFAQQGYSDWLEGLARMAEQGDLLMRIENGGMPIADQAMENSEDPKLEFNIGFVPSPFSVKTNYERAKVNIGWQVNKPVIEAAINRPQHSYKPGEVHTELKQYPTLTIEVEEPKINQLK
ncbi:hypothetical protein GA0061096_2302 [Fictibacillus enclensis]|uniref:Uncharacterized protein n=1 Tax=Fictibacillus enclensis TaxID=1017270 RepID=A0A0V8J899_9BACL|nr:DUF6470 family protein [Fictibacillus enclensis]KSU83100.1 hypothetical protein AS030_10960 [Fictibacillus enclensis]SCC10102.1 hypothetical protein GA0061096_2302 [Fictibacillus enclensis]